MNGLTQQIPMKKVDLNFFIKCTAVLHSRKPGAVQSHDFRVFSLQSNMAAQGLTIEAHEECGWCFGEKNGDQLGSWDQLGKLK